MISPSTMENAMSRIVLGFLFALATFPPAIAQEWPTRTITLVVPFTPGGGVDISARLQAQAIGDILGQNVIVENIGGAAGITAGARLAPQPPDRYRVPDGNTATHPHNPAPSTKPPH